MTPTAAIEMAEGVVKRLGVRLTLVILILTVSYGFVRLARVEQLAEFLTCEAIARIQGVSPRPCITYVQSPDQYLTEALNTSENP